MRTDRRRCPARDRVRRLALCVLVVGVVLTAATASSARPKPPPLAPYHYDAQGPLAPIVLDGGEDRGHRRSDVTFVGIGNHRDEAVLLLPDTPPPFPAVLLADDTDSEWSAEAVALVQQGVASLELRSLDDPDLAPVTPSRVGLIGAAYVRNFRRALDDLVSQPEVDRTRLGFAETGSLGVLLLGVDHRLKAAVLLSPAGNAYGIKLSLGSPPLAGASRRHACGSCV